MLRWKKEERAEAEPVWGALAACNTAIAEAFRELRALQMVDPFEYNKSLQWASNNSHAAWSANTENVRCRSVDMLFVDAHSAY